MQVQILCLWEAKYYCGWIKFIETDIALYMTAEERQKQEAKIELTEKQIRKDIRKDKLEHISSSIIF